jgi:hypothetical protein
MRIKGRKGSTSKTNSTPVTPMWAGVTQSAKDAKICKALQKKVSKIFRFRGASYGSLEGASEANKLNRTDA